MLASLARRIQKRLGGSWAIPLGFGLAALIIGVSVPYILISIYFSSSLFKDEQKLLNESHLAYAKALSFSLDSQFRIIESGLQSLSHSYALTDGSLPMFYAQATKLAQSQGLLGVVLSDRSGQIIFSTNRPYGAPLPSLVKGATKSVFEECRSSISNLFMGPIVKDWIMAVRVPVVDKGGNVLYALSATYSADQLNQFLMAQKPPQPNLILGLVDPVGRIAGRTKSPKEIVGSMIRPNFQKHLASEPVGLFEGVNLQSVPVSVAYYQSGETKWTVYITAAIADINERKWSKLTPFIALSFAALAAGLLFGWYVNTRITSAIKKLIPHAQDLGLGNRVQYVPGAISEVNEVARALVDASNHLEAANYRSFHDPLTGLANRALVNFNVVQQLALANREHQCLALLFLDLDDFKKINDTYGHEAGDLLLQEVSLRLKNTVRTSDTVARLGGDEFVVLLLNTDESLALTIAQKVLMALADTPISLGSSQTILTCSIGVAVYPHSAADEHDLFRQADRALYIAKKLGRNQVYAASGLDQSS